MEVETKESESGLRITNWKVPYYPDYELIVKMIVSYVHDKPKEGEDLRSWLERKVKEDKEK